MKQPLTASTTMRGILLLLAGAFLFALSTVFVKFASQPPYGISGIQSAFMRFLLGFIAFFGYALYNKIPLRSHNVPLVIWRGVLNTLAVILFFAGVQYTTVTTANILNLTYPAFIFLVAPFINKEKSPAYFIIFLLLALTGALLIAGANGFSFGSGLFGDILSFASGITAAFALSVLREARKYDHAITILVTLFGIGSVICGVIMIPVFVMPFGFGLLYMLAAATCGIIGQLLLTVGYKYIDAASGGIVLASGIVFGALLGHFIFHDPLTVNVVAGSLLVLIALAGIGFADRRIA